MYREEELQLQKRKKRKIKGNSRLSFAEDIENGSEEEEAENSKLFFPYHFASLITFQIVMALLQCCMSLKLVGALS